MTVAGSQFVWEETFPPVYGHTSISFLKNCPGFGDAKQGNIQAALFVVNICAKSNRISELKQKYPDAVLVPVITNNKLPMALAQKIGLRVHINVYDLHAQSRKTFSAMERLLHKPSFCGNIICGQRFIIVDDIVTQGGTISALRKYIIFNGGIVVAVVALAFAAGSHILVPELRDIYNLTDKFSVGQLSSTLTKYSIADDLWELTRSQVRYLLSFKEINTMEKKIQHVIARSYSCNTVGVMVK